MSSVVTQKPLRLNIELDRDVAARLYHYIIRKYGQLRGNVSSTIQKAVEEFLERHDSPGAEAPAAPSRGEDKTNLKNKSPQEKPPDDVIVDETLIKRILGFLPRQINIDVLKSMLTSRGIDEKVAELAIQNAINNGVYKRLEGAKTLVRVMDV